MVRKELNEIDLRMADLLPIRDFTARAMTLPGGVLAMIPGGRLLNEKRSLATTTTAASLRATRIIDSRKIITYAECPDYFGKAICKLRNGEALIK